MFLIDTNVISELRKGARADAGVVSFVQRNEQEIFLPVQVIGELRFGIEKLRHRCDFAQAQMVEEWFQFVLEAFDERILDFDEVCAQIWGTLMGANEQHIVDKQIAAIALVYGLTVVTRNSSDFRGTGVPLLNPFLADATSADPMKHRKSH